MEAIMEALHKGAPFSYVNVVVFCFSLAIIAERIFFIRSRYSINSTEFMNQIRKLIQAGNIDRAVRLCEKAATYPLLDVIKSGLTQINRGDEIVVATMEERMSDLIPDLEKRVGSLWSLANIATLIGLLGTISGLIKSFAAVGTLSDPSQKSAVLSAGIAEAMWNTMIGLFIAVVCMTAHLFIHGMVKKQKLNMEKATMRLENLLTLRSAENG